MASDFDFTLAERIKARFGQVEDTPETNPFYKDPNPISPAATEQERLDKIELDIQQAQTSMLQRAEQGQDTFALRAKERYEKLQSKKQNIEVLKQDPKDLLRKGTGLKIKEGELTDKALRADLSFSDTDEEKKLKFLDKYPDGDFMRVKQPELPSPTPLPTEGFGGETVLVRRNQNEPYFELDSSDLNMMDLYDFTGELPEIGAEAFMLYMTQGTGLLREVLAAGFGSIIGETTEEAVEKFRGYQKETLGELGVRIPTEGLIASGGAGVASLALEAPIQTLRFISKPFRGVDEQEKALVKWLNKHNLPHLRPDQISSHPLIQRLGFQSSALVPDLKQYTRKQNQAMVDTLLSMRDEDVRRFIKGEFTQIHDEAIEQLRQALPQIEGSLLDGGYALERAIVDYDNLSESAVNRAFTNARDLAGDSPVTYNTAQADAVIDEITSGFPIPMKDEVGFSLDAEVPLSSAQPDTQTEVIHPKVQLAIKLLKEGDINAPEQVINGRKITSTDRLRRVRQFLHDIRMDALKPSASEQSRMTREQLRQVNKLDAAVRYIMDNPISDSAEVVEAYKIASKEAAKRFETLEDIFIKEALSTKEGRRSFALAQKIGMPGGDVDDLIFAETVLKQASPSEWNKFKSGVHAELLQKENIGNLKKRLKEYNKEQKDRLFAPGEFEAMDKIADEVERIKLLNIEEIRIKQEKTNLFVSEILSTKDSGAIKKLIEHSGEAGSPRRKIIRTAVINNVINDVVGRQTKGGAKGMLAIDGQLLENKLKEMAETGLIKTLTANDVNMLKNLSRVSKLLSPPSDTGTSLIAAQTAADFKELFSPNNGGLSAATTIVEAHGMARLLMNDKFANWILSEPKKRSRISTVKLMGAVMAELREEALSDLERSVSTSNNNQ